MFQNENFVKFSAVFKRNNFEIFDIAQHSKMSKNSGSSLFNKLFLIINFQNYFC